MPKKAENITGRRFNRLIVIKFILRNKTKYFWECKCDCGNIKIIEKRALVSGATKSCGCLNKELIIKRATKHGLHKTKVYKTWIGIKNRCYNKNYSKFYLYGERGIKVCDRWLEKNGFINFFQDMGHPPSPNHSIDRINNNGNYEPNNCRWATIHEQNRNTRFNINITQNGETHCVSEWARILNMKKSTIYNRLFSGWKLEDSLK